MDTQPIDLWNWILELPSHQEPPGDEDHTVDQSSAFEETVQVSDAIKTLDLYVLCGA